MGKAQKIYHILAEIAGTKLKDPNAYQREAKMLSLIPQLVMKISQKVPRCWKIAAITPIVKKLGQRGSQKPPASYSAKIYSKLLNML